MHAAPTGTVRPWRFLVAPALAGGLAALVIGAPPTAHAASGPPGRFVVTGPESAILPPSYVTDETWGLPSVACGNDRCLAVWNWGRMMMFDGSGRPISKVTQPLEVSTGQTCVTWSGSDFVVAGVKGKDLTTVRIGSDGAMRGAVVQATTPGAVVEGASIAVGAGHFLLAWYEQSGAPGAAKLVLRARLLDTQLVPAAPALDLAATNDTDPTKLTQVRARGDGFFVISRAEMYSLDSGGALIAGPKPVLGASSIPYGGVITATFGDNLAITNANKQAFGTRSIELFDGKLLPTPKVFVSTPGGDSALAMGSDASSVLYLASDTSRTTGYQYDLSFSMPPKKAMPFSVTGFIDYGAVANLGSGYMLVLSGEYLLPDRAGMMVMPLDNTGQALASEPTLLSVGAASQSLPVVTPSATGFWVACDEYRSWRTVLSLDADGRPTAAARAHGADNTRFSRQVPNGIAAGPGGAMALLGDPSQGELVTMRVDATGAAADDPPLRATGMSAYAGAIAWDGRNFVAVSGSLGRVLIAPDGTVGAVDRVFSADVPGGSADRVALAAGDGATLLAWTRAYDPPNQSTSNYVFVSRLDGAGHAMDNPPLQIPSPTLPGSWASKGIAVEREGDSAGAGWLAAWDEVDSVLTGAYKSEVRAIRIGPDGRLRDTAPLIVHSQIGAPPDDDGMVSVPVDSVGAAFDGAVHWIAWRDPRGAWVRRISAAGQAIDAAPVNVVGGALSDVRISSRGDGRVLLLYARRDDAPDVRSDRVQARLLTASDMPGPDGGAADGGAGDTLDGGPDSDSDSDGGGRLDAAVETPGGAGDALDAPADAGSPPADAPGGAPDGLDAVDGAGGGDRFASADAAEAPPADGGTGTGDGAASPDARAPASEGGCSCALAVSNDRAPPVWLVGAVALLVARRRRRGSARGRLALLAVAVALPLGSSACSGGGPGTAMDAAGGGDVAAPASGSGGRSVADAAGPDQAEDQTGTDAIVIDASPDEATGGDIDADADADARLDHPADAADASDGATDLRADGDAAQLGPDAGTDAAGEAGGDGAGDAAGDVVTDAGQPLRVQAVAGGDLHACALTTDGRVKCWGGNSAGALGNESYGTFGADRNHGGDNMPFTPLGTGRTAVAIAAQEDNTCALLDNATLKCWGQNYQGQLGQEDLEPRGRAAGSMGDNLHPIALGTGRTVRTMAVGGQHVCAVLDNGQLKCWGGAGTGATYSPLGLEDRQSHGAFAGSMGDHLPAVNLGTGRTAVAVSCGGGHSCAILDNGCVKCWGSGLVGSLGLGSTRDWGDEPGEMGDNLPCVSLGSGLKPRAITSGSGSNCVIFDDGRLKCWGHNSAGALGLGGGSDRGDEPGEMGDALPFVDLGPGRTATAVSIGGYHMCARLNGGDVKCWGDNAFGNLGLGDGRPRGILPGEMGAALPTLDLGTGLTASGITSLIWSSCAVLSNQRIKCWGSGEYGQHGSSLALILGDRPGEMGDNLPYADLGRQ